MNKAHFLNRTPLDFADPAVNALWELLWVNFPRQKDTLIIAGKAGVIAALVDWEQPMMYAWRELLHTSHQQGKLRALLDAVRAHPLSGDAVSRRMDELLADEPVVEAPLNGAGGRIDFVWRGGSEALTGDRNTMLDASFLELGARRARSVVRLLVGFEGRPQSYGSGFVIGPNRVLTNYHVLHDIVRGSARAQSVEVWFHYERGADGQDRTVKPVRADCASIRGEEPSDWAIIDLSEQAPGECEPLSLSPKVPVTVGDRVYIIQHPAGGPKKIGMHHNEVRYTDKDIVQYMTDTLAGSSGSPVFNDRWEVVALHHRTVNANEGVRNQGILIQRVVDGLQRRAAV